MPAGRWAGANILYWTDPVEPPEPVEITPAGLGNYGTTVLGSSPVAFWRFETNVDAILDSADAPDLPQSGPQNGVYQDISIRDLGQPGPRPSDLVNGQPLLGFDPNNHAVNFQGNGKGGNDVALFAVNFFPVWAT